jgi:hypothetical protein
MLGASSAQDGYSVLPADGRCWPKRHFKRRVLFGRYREQSGPEIVLTSVRASRE